MMKDRISLCEPAEISEIHVTDERAISLFYVGLGLQGIVDIERAYVDDDWSLSCKSSRQNLMS